MAQVADVAIPVVFPDYLIAVDTPQTSIPIPDLPFFDIPGIPKQITIPKSHNKVPFLGHGGALFFQGSTGTTKYYEYGRYDPAALGLVRKVSVPNVKMTGENPDRASLAALLAKVSRSSGQNGRILGAYISLPGGAYTKMLAYADKRLAENTNPKRAPYELLSNSCNTFMQQVCVAGGASMPAILLPNPAGYIRLVRMSFPVLDYAGGIVTVPALGY
ncbi:MAG: hypothetical protein ABI972_16765 [Acidobacteriota bacterium]